MKKYLIALVALLVVVTGCGNNTNNNTNKENSKEDNSKAQKLVCTLEDGETKEESILYYEKDELVKLEAISTVDTGMTVADSDMSLYDALVCSALEAEYEEGLDCSVSAAGTAIKVTISIDVTKMTAEDLDELGYSSEGTSYAEMKKSSEDAGFTCK